MGQKIGAAFFIVLLAGAACLIGWRIAQKPAYEAREQMQCDLLAVSLAEALAADVRNDPALLAQFEQAASLGIDHRLMTEGWAVALEVRPVRGGAEVAAAAGSHWNSRSPKKSEVYAFISKEGTLIYADPAVEPLAEAVRGAKSADAGKTFSFTYRNENEPDVPIRVRAAKAPVRGGEKSYLLFFPKN